MEEESYEKYLHKNRHREMFSTRKYVIFSMFRTIPWNSNSFQVIVKFLLLFSHCFISWISFAVTRTFQIVNSKEIA